MFRDFFIYLDFKNNFCRRPLTLEAVLFYLFLYRNSHLMLNIAVELESKEMKEI